MIRFLQINLGVCRSAQDLMVHTARECNADVVLISEQYRNASEDVGWYSDAAGRAAVYITSGISVDATGPLDIGFRWVLINGMRVYSVYYSPNVTLAEYNLFLNRLESSVRGSDGPVLIAGDFNAKRPEWGSPITDQRGDALAELAASLDLHVCNTGGCPTFVRGASESYIDVTFASRSIWQKISNWRVLDEDSLSLHLYIAFDISPVIDSVPQPPPSGWNWRKLDREKLSAFLDTRPMAGFGTTNTLGLQPESLDAYLAAACDCSMPRKSYHGGKRPVHWWTEEISDLRKNSFASRRLFQRARKRRGPEACIELEQAAREAMKALRIAIKKSQENCWKKLCQTVEEDPWGLPYRLVMKRLTTRRPIPGLSLPGRLQEIIHGLFPTRQFVDWQISDDTDVIDEVTATELVELAHALPLGKAPGPDGVPDLVVKAVILRKTADVTSILNNCLRSGSFPRRWKEARLVLIRKPGKPLEVPSSYRPLSMVNTIGKLFERVIKRRLEAHLLRNPEGLSGNQFGFRRGRSTIDAIEKLLDTVNRNEAKPWRRRELCALVSIDVANAFNTVPWEKIGDALMRKNTPSHLVRLLRDYLRERLLQTDAGDIEVTSGVPQGSVIGPILWNIFYDGLLQQRLTEGIEIIAFADDIAVVGIAENTDLLEAAMNGALSLVSEWIETNGLSISVSKTVAMTMTTKRRYRRPQFVLLGETLELKEHIKYLGVELNSKLGFKEHIKMIRAKALKTTAALSRLMPNVGGPSPTKRKLLTSVVNSQLLYAAPVWHLTTKFRNHRQLLLGPQRTMALRVASAYRTVSTAAIMVVAGTVPVHLMASGRAELRRLQMNRTENARQIVDNLVWGWWQQEWEELTTTGQWTKRLIPDVRPWVTRTHGMTNYHITQFLTGHGCFQSYLQPRSTWVESPECLSCGDPEDDVEHTFFRCDRWARGLTELETTVGEDVTPETIIPIMLNSRGKWEAVEGYVRKILTTKEEEEFQRHINGP
uniref:Reverse transcriptase domain-containing protein n=1 Tax=Schizaphis graminum TaxID=13262 RepID=A0A2S2NQQ6_SCHGA